MRSRSHRGISVDLAELAVVATHKVKAPAIKANAVLQEAQPLDDVIADALLRVVNVGCRRIIIARLVSATASKRWIIVADGGVVPRQPTTKFVPLAIAALVCCAAARADRLRTGRE
jgi:hypothetical protein